MPGEAADPRAGAEGRTGRVLLAVALGLAAAVAVAPRPGSAQQPPADEEAAWLGVGLRQSIRCRTRVEARPDGTVERTDDSGCRRAFVAEAIVEGAPADRAGLQPGDTLVAVNGRALSRVSGRKEFETLEPGRPAQVLLGRPGEGRVSVRVVPETRPPRAELAQMEVRTAAPGDRGAPAAISPGSPDPAEPTARARGVVIGTDEKGRIFVRTGDGDTVRPSEFEGLAPRLEAIRDSVFARARRHLRAIRKHQREALRRAREAAGEHAGAVAGVPPAGAEEGPLRPESVRAAGAEFRPLAEGLAEYFPGADRGLLVMEVVPGTPAAELGLRPGDVVVEAGGRRVAVPADLREALGEYPRRDSLVVKWMRKGKEVRGVLRSR